MSTSFLSCLVCRLPLPSTISSWNTCLRVLVCESGGQVNMRRDGSREVSQNEYVMRLPTDYETHSTIHVIADIPVVSKVINACFQKTYLIHSSELNCSAT